MPRRNNSGNMNNAMGRFMGSMGRKQNNMGNMNRSGGNRGNFGGGLASQVNPWLSQNASNNSVGGMGRNLASDQQAQLALASTLLNNLLKPGSQLNKLPANPPSLLSLNHSAPSSLTSFGGSANNFSRDRFNFGRQNLDKVQKNYRKGDFKNKRFGDRKNRKSNQANKQANAEKKVEKKDVKKEEIKVESMDVDPSTRDVNEETPAETATNESGNENNPKVGEESKKTKVKDKEPKMSYNDIPSALLFCHICRKHMWDDASFEKHLEGRPHKFMVEELDRSYKLKVELLRHEMRVAEQQRENDIQRANRKQKNSHKAQQRDFCTMCNLSFMGMLPAHRKNERHQRLKKFLHPKCNVCSKEFYTRLEWDDHKLTPAHLKRLAEIRKETRPDLEDTEFDIIDFIEDIDEEYDMENIELKVVGKRDSLNDLRGEKCEVATNDGENETNEEKNKEETNEEKSKNETNEEKSKNETNEEKNEEDDEYKKLPKYTPGVPVGENYVVDKTGFLCRVCNKFCVTSEDVKTHCQSVMHYNNIIKILKAQNKIVRKRRLNDAKTEDDGGEGKGKKRKVSTGDKEQLTEMNGTAEIKQEAVGDVYDPEDPGSENEKDQEVQTSGVKNQDGTKLTVDDQEKKSEAESNDSKVLDASNEANVTTNKDDVNDTKESSGTGGVPAEPPKEVKKGKQTAIRGPRARRGRRHY